MFPSLNDKYYLLIWVFSIIWAIGTGSFFRTSLKSFWTRSQQPYCYGRHTDWNCPPWPGTIVTTGLSYFMTGGPIKENEANKPPPIRRVQERSKGDTTCPTSSQNPPHWNPFLLNNACTTRKAPESEWLARDNPETNPITVKPETAIHVAEQFSRFPLRSCPLPGHPFPMKSLALSAHVSSQTIYFQVLDKSALLGPGRGPCSCSTTSTGCWHLRFFYKAPHFSGYQQQIKYSALATLYSNQTLSVVLLFPIA